MQPSSHDFTAHWCTGTPARSPLLMLGGSVVAAVMLIGTGLSMLGTETAVPGRAEASLAQRLAVSQRGAAPVTVADAAQLKALHVASVEAR